VIKKAHSSVLAFYQKTKLEQHTLRAKVSWWVHSVTWCFTS